MGNGSGESREAILPSGDAATVADHGYLLECHARNLLRQGCQQYRRASELDPGWDKVRHQLMHAMAALFEPHEAIVEHWRRLAQSPQDVREHRLLAYALLVDARVPAGGRGGAGRAGAGRRGP